MTQTKVTEVDAGKQAVARRVIVNAPAKEIFDLVANPHLHHELDGSGTVRDTEVKGPARLTGGAKFSVGMKQYGVPYKITSKVVGFDEGHLIEWRHPIGHTWRWELVEISPGVTQVTETFDYSTAKVPKALELFGMTKNNAVGITTTLEQLAARFA